jgi:hypothetical protein
MSYSHAVTPDHPLCGTWFPHSASTPEASLYKQVEYTISVVEKQFRITGIDWSNSERIVICDIAYDGEWIRFQSLHPSTGRSGCNWMRIIDKNKIEFRFTFTDKEFWVRKRFGGKGSRAVSLQTPLRRRNWTCRKLVSPTVPGRIENPPAAGTLA